MSLRARHKLLVLAASATMYLAAVFGRGPLAGSGLPGTRSYIPPPPVMRPPTIVKVVRAPTPPLMPLRGSRLRERGEALMGRRTPARVDASTTTVQ